MATNDLITLAEARALVGLGANQDPTTLELYISSASQLLDVACGPIIQRTITAEQHRGGVPKIALNSFPVASVTTVTEYDGTTATTLTAETPGTVPTAGYLFDPVRGTITRRSGGCDYWFAPTFVTVTYVSGRYADTAAVDSRFKHACKMTISNWWRFENGATATLVANGGGSGMPTFSLPRAVLELLQADRLVPGVA